MHAKRIAGKLTKGRRRLAAPLKWNARFLRPSHQPKPPAPRALTAYPSPCHQPAARLRDLWAKIASAGTSRFLLALKLSGQGQTGLTMILTKSRPCVAVATAELRCGRVWRRFARAVSACCHPLAAGGRFGRTHWRVFPGLSQRMTLSTVHARWSPPNGWTRSRVWLAGDTIPDAAPAAAQPSFWAKNSAS